MSSGRDEVNASVSPGRGILERERMHAACRAKRNRNVGERARKNKKPGAEPGFLHESGRWLRG